MAKYLWKVSVVMQGGTDEWHISAPDGELAREKAMKLTRKVNDADEYPLRYIESVVVLEIDA